MKTKNEILQEIEMEADECMEVLSLFEVGKNIVINPYNGRLHYKSSFRISGSGQKGRLLTAERELLKNAGFTACYAGNINIGYKRMTAKEVDQNLSRWIKEQDEQGKLKRIV